MDEKRLQEVFADEIFVKRLLELETPEAARKALSEKGIDLSIEEVKGVGKLMAKVVEKADENGGELSIDDLEEVAGGALSTAAMVVVNLVTTAAKPAIIPAIAAAATAATAVSAFLRRW